MSLRGVGRLGCFAWESPAFGRRDRGVVLADGGPRITDRDLVAAVVAAENLMAAQTHRFQKVAEVIMARDC